MKQYVCTECGAVVAHLGKLPVPYCRKCECSKPMTPSINGKPIPVILGVAIKQGSVCICLPKPSRHHHCIRFAVDVLGLSPPIGEAAESQGFYTADGTFLNRSKALKLAKENGQLINKEAKHYLFSEDLW